MDEKDKQEMIAAMKTIRDFCMGDGPCNSECPFYNNCFRSVSPAWWKIPGEED